MLPMPGPMPSTVGSKGKGKGFMEVQGSRSDPVGPVKGDKGKGSLPRVNTFHRGKGGKGPGGVRGKGKGKGGHGKGRGRGRGRGGGGGGRGVRKFCKRTGSWIYEDEMNRLSNTNYKDLTTRWDKNRWWTIRIWPGYINLFVI